MVELSSLFVPSTVTGPVSLELLFVPFSSHLSDLFPMFTPNLNTNHDKQMLGSIRMMTFKEASTLFIMEMNLFTDGNLAYR